MFGPGTYRPDPTEGITAIADLPQPAMVPYSRNNTRNVCPRCGHVAYRDKQSHRTLHDLGNLELVHLWGARAQHAVIMRLPSSTQPWRAACFSDGITPGSRSWSPL